MATFSRPSTQSLIVVLGLLMVWIALVVSESFHIVPTGLRVHLVRPGIRFASNAGIQPLLIYVARDPHGNGSLFLIGSQAVQAQALAALLRVELNRRPPDWPVYVEGDPDLAWQQVAEAIDAARGQHAEVILLTGSSGRRW